MTLEQIWLFVGVAVLGVAIVHFAITSAREATRASNGQPRLGNLRLIIAAIAAGTAIFAGGCGAILGAAELMRPHSGAADDFMDWQLVAIFSLPPFLIAAFIWWLAMRRKTT
jgi:cytochrome bd-type quinol oxidase subunit 2